VRLGVSPLTAWLWAYLVGEGRPLVAVRDHEVTPPRGNALEVRAEGLWSAITCETPVEHWSIGLEAFAVGMDDPADAYRGERGDRVPLGLDLEWEAAAPVFNYPDGTRYGQPCQVHGQVLVGDERLDFDGSGQREHAWGVQDWWVSPWYWTAGRLGDATTFAGLSTTSLETGYVWRPEGPFDPVASVTTDAPRGPDGLQLPATVRIGDTSLAVTPLHHAPVLLEGASGNRSRLLRSLCRFVGADGRIGVGWAELLQL
jgi:hypothetical protein